MKKETKRKIGDCLFNALGAPVAAGLLRVMARWSHNEWQNRDTFERVLAGSRPVIFVFWHEDMIAIALHYIRTRFGELGVMVSRSRDGEKLARILRRLGMTPIRASSSRGAVAGVIEAVRYLRPEGKPPKKQGYPRGTALALDGPRGPRRQVKPGVALIARKSDALVLPIGYLHSSQKAFGSWDRTKLPLPFCRTTILVGPMLDVTEWPGDDASFTAEIQQEMDRLHESE